MPPARFFSYALVGLVLLSPLACRPNSTDKRGDSFRIGLDIGDYNPKANPFLSSSGSESIVNNLLYSGLFAQKPDNRLEPDLAASYTVNPERTEWTVTLRDNLKFHDGSAVTSEDVAYSFDTVLKHPDSTFYPLLTSITEVRKIDPRTVRFTLKRQDEFFDTALMLVYIVPNDSLDDGKTGLPNGTGPFLYKKYDAASSVLQLGPNPSYHEGEPPLRSVLFSFLPSQMEGLSLLMKGDIDSMYLADPTYKRLFEENQNFRLIYSQTPLLYAVSLNPKDPMFADPHVKKALNHIAPRKQILESMEEGRDGLELFTSFIPDAKEGSLNFDYDDQKALSHLKEAGWGRKGNWLVNSQGKTMEFKILSIAEHEFSNNVLHYLSREMQKIGIRVIPQIRSLSQLLSEGFLNADFDAAIWPLDVRNLDFYLYTYWHSSLGNKTAEPAGFQDRLDGDLDHIRYAKSRDERLAAYREFESTLSENPPFIFLFRRPIPIIVHRRFRGYDERPWDFTLEIKKLWVAEKDRKPPSDE